MERQSGPRCESRRSQNPAYVRGFLWIPLVLFRLCASVAGGIKEDTTIEIKNYCFPDSFNATCGEDEVLLLQQARYGRMRQVECLHATDNLGCWADARPQLDTRCSGRRQCMVSIPDPELHKLQPCPRDAMAYLEVAHQCVQVEQGTGKTCGFSGGLPLAGASGYLSSSITDVKGYGSPRCPWKLQLPEGQRVNISLYDFGIEQRSEAEENLCLVYAKISERTLPSPITVCGGRQRHKAVYMSETNSVTMEVLSVRDQGDLPIHFLLHYHAVGCAAPVIPEGAWYERTGESAVVACNYTSQIWHILCHDNAWVGQMDRCAIPTPSPKVNKKDNGDDKNSGFQYGLLVAIVAGVLLGIVIGVALLSVVFCCHKRRKRARAAARKQGSGTCASGTGYRATGPGSVFQDGQTVQQETPVYGYTHMYTLKHADGCPAHPKVSTCKTAIVMDDHLQRPQSQLINQLSTNTYEKPGISKDDQVTMPVTVTDSGFTPFYHEFEGEGHTIVDGGSTDHKYISEPNRYTD